MRLLLLTFFVSGLACASGEPPTPAEVVAPVVTPVLPEVPLYHTRELTRADLDGRSLRELQLMRNTIFARAGNPFRKAWLAEYFKAQPWYVPALRMDESRLTELDRRNAAFIAEYEARIPRAELVRRRDAVLARIGPDYVQEDAIEVFLLARALGENAFEYPQADFLGEDFTTFEVTPLDDPRILDRQLTVEDLKDLSRRDLRILRNMVYARHGRAFKSDVLQSWFGNLAWYRVDPAYSDSRLTEVDKRNVTLIRSVEDSIGGPMSDEEHREEWFGGA